jgi:acyl carrier protein
MSELGRIKADVLAIVDELAGISPADVEADYGAVLGLDSIQLVAIAARIEQHFGIQLPMAALWSTTMDDLLGLLQREVDARTGGPA